MSGRYRTWSTPPTRLQADCLRCRCQGLARAKAATVLGITPSSVDCGLRTAKEKIIGMTGRELEEFAERESIDVEALRLIIRQSMAAGGKPRADHGAYLPTPEEIEAACRRMREYKDVEESVAWEVPEVAVASLG